MIRVLLLVFLLHNATQAGVKYKIPASLSVLVKSDSVLRSQVGITEKTGNNDGEVENI